MGCKVAPPCFPLHLRTPAAAVATSPTSDLGLVGRRHERWGGDLPDCGGVIGKEQPGAGFRFAAWEPRPQAYHT